MAVRVGIMGFAHGHVQAYCAQWRDRPELGVTAVAAWDHDPERLKQSAEAFGLQPFADRGAFLADAGLDAVVVAAETSLHADLVEEAAAAGKAIIVQKPIAITMADADRIVTAVERHGVPFTMAWQMRTDPQNIKMRELVRSGELGKVLMVRRRHALATHLWPGFADTWHASPTYNRDIWADDASHPIDLIQWMLGVPATVTAELDTLVDPRVPNDNGIAIFRYPGGPIAEVTCSFTCAAHEPTTEIVAERGTIIQNFGDGPSCGPARSPDAVGLKWFSVDAGRWVCSDIASPPGHGDRIAGLSAPLAEFLRGECPPICTAEEGRMSLRMLLACYVSTREGRRVRIDDEAIAGV
jgi:predicted dehydrogenase